MCAEYNTIVSPEQQAISAAETVASRWVGDCNFARLQVHDLVERCGFSYRELECLRVVRQETLDRGFPQVYIADLGFFASATGLDRAEVSRGIDELEADRVIQAPAKVGPGSRRRRPGGWYGINVLFDSWRVERRRAHVHALGLMPRYPDLNDALRMRFVEMGAPSSRGEISGGVSGDDPGSGCVCRDPDQEGVGKFPTQLGNSQQRGTEASPASVGKIPIGPQKRNVFAGESGGIGKIPIQLGNSQQGGRVSPPVPPFPKRVNVERSTLNGVAAGLGNGEARLLDELQGWLGAEEMVNNGGLWRGYLRMPGGPEIVERELHQGRSLERELNPADPRRPKSRAAWLNWYVRRQLVPGYVRERGEE